jgi:hypothetical protein
MYRLTGLPVEKGYNPVLWACPTPLFLVLGITHQHTSYIRIHPLTIPSTKFTHIYSASAQMPARSALESCVSRIRTTLHKRSLANDSHGTSTRERARTSSFDSYDSITSLKHNTHKTQSRQVPKSSVCSFLPGNLAMGLSRVMARTRHQSQTNTEPVNHDARRQYFSNLPNASTRLSKTSSQIWNEKETHGQYHSHNVPTLSGYSRIAPRPLPIKQSEGSGVTKPPSINWHAQTPGVNGTGKVRLILRPSISPWGRGTYVTTDVPDGVSWNSSLHRRTMAHFIGKVHKKQKKLKGPFWDRKTVTLNDAVGSVISDNEKSRKGTPGGAWIGVREDTQKLSASFVLKEDWKHFKGDVKGFWNSQVKPVAGLCLSSLQSRG